MDYWAQEKAIIEDDLSECEAILNELRVEADMGCEAILDGLEKIKKVRLKIAKVINKALILNYFIPHTSPHIVLKLSILSLFLKMLKISTTNPVCHQHHFQ